LEETLEGKARNKNKKPVYDFSDLEKKKNKVEDKPFIDIDP
jgi:hypothetical protein